MKAKKFFLAAAVGVFPTILSQAAQPVDPTSGQALYADVKHFEQFGIHRFGTEGQNAALDWLADRMKAAGLVVEEQAFTVDHQYFLDAASLKVGGEMLDVVPQWWPPKTAASFSLSAAIVSEGQAEGKFIRLKIPYDSGAYLGKNQRDALDEAMKRRPAVVLLTIDHPSGEIFTYNVSQEDEPWPVPVILVAAKDEAKLARAAATGENVTVAITGHYERKVQSRNIIGRLDRGMSHTIVVSTPVSSWFTSTCERGPGIAALLAMAKVAVQSLKDTNFVFVGTSGHEVGHGGMEYFIHDKAPKPSEVAAWLHYGASLACYAKPMTGADSDSAATDNRSTRFLLMSTEIRPFV